MLPITIDALVLVEVSNRLFEALQEEEESQRTISAYEKAQTQIAVTVAELDNILKPLVNTQRELIKKWHQLDNERIELEKSQKASAIKKVPAKEKGQKKPRKSMDELVAGMSEEEKAQLLQMLSNN